MEIKRVRQLQCRSVISIIKSLLGKLVCLECRGHLPVRIGKGKLLSLTLRSLVTLLAPPVRETDDLLCSACLPGKHTHLIQHSWMITLRVLSSLLPLDVSKAT